MALALALTKRYNSAPDLAALQVGWRGGHGSTATYRLIRRLTALHGSWCRMHIPGELRAIVRMHWLLAPLLLGLLLLAECLNTLSVAPHVCIF